MLTTDSILKLLDELTNREASYAEQLGDEKRWHAATCHQYQANGIALAAAEIRRRVEAENKQELPHATT